MSLKIRHIQLSFYPGNEMAKTFFLKLKYIEIIYIEIFLKNTN